MITDIFYPIFTLTITVLTYFIRKKNWGGAEGGWAGVRTNIFTKALPWGSGGLQLPPDPQLLSFLAWPKIDAPIFFLYFPLKVILTCLNLILRISHKLR